MKFNPLSVIKKKFTFEFIQENNIETEEIKAADYLICWVEEENARIIEEESEGSVVIVKRNKKDQVLYAHALEFPMAPETDFDSLLDKFYTRKPIKFDQTILEGPPNPVPVPEIAAPPVPPVPPIPAAVPPTQTTEPTEGYASVPTVPAAETAEVVTESSNSNEIQELIAAQKAQQEEIKLLKQQLEERKAAATQEKIPEPIPVLANEEVPVKSETKKQKNSVSIGVPGVGTTKSLSSFEPSAIDAGLSFQDRMDLFVEQEKQKIETEIFTVDSRDLIETEVMVKIKEEKEESISRTEMDLYEKQAEAIEKEEKRHAVEMERINQEYEKQIEAKTKMIEDKFKRKAAAEIRSEYNRQTKELKQLFDERMIELKKRQTEFSNKLMENIRTTFSTLDLDLNEEPQEQEKETDKIPVLAELKTIRAGE
ncbi:hypothetical protein [Enterococcus sp. DIV0187]|uniref:hypothetical protein n=1 Tax=Enterococcus sp. DIV0187 TaxID=2774644 RepID=UPI003F1F2969